MAMTSDVTLAEFIIRPATLDDAPALVELLNACSREVYGVAEDTVENLVREWHAPGFDLATDSCAMFEPDGRLVAYGDLWSVNPSGVRLMAWGRVHPGYRGRGLGSYLMGRSEAEARQRLDRAPQGARVVLEAAAYRQDVAALQLFEGCGLNHVRSFWRMTIDLDSAPPAPRWPDGIRVCSLAELGTGDEEYRRVFSTVRESFRGAWGVVEQPFETDYARWTHFMRWDGHDPALWFLALSGDEVAGVSLCRLTTQDDHQNGWVSTLGVLSHHRRRGVALALLAHSFGELYRRGYPRISLGVDTENATGATRVYERAGMHVERETAVYHKELRPGFDMSTQAAPS
jgi:ribosomal protein S18 acetylase RimI-like enzyme